jgi:sugar phosphate permease
MSGPAIGTYEGEQVTIANSSVGRSRNLVLAAMIFAVAMTFIDQTIVSIAVPQIQKELGLTSTGVQWAVNGYLLALAALFAFGGRLADTVGHRKMVTLGVIIFAASSALCGLTPKGLDRGSLDRDVPRGARCWRSDHVPRRARHRRADLRPT